VYHLLQVCLVYTKVGINFSVIRVLFTLRSETSPFMWLTSGLISDVLNAEICFWVNRYLALPEVLSKFQRLTLYNNSVVL
jgi:hypothetical protein